jgi:hypothetical protein
MDISELRNPYDYANPVKDASLFAGRADSLAKITYLLDQAGPSQPVSYIAIHGKRAAGKTSLLNMTEFLARERQYLTVRVDLVGSDSSPKEFYTKVYEELIGAIGRSIELKTSDGRAITPRIVRRIISAQFTDEHFPLEFPESLSSHEGAGSPISEMALRADLEYLAKQIGRTIVILIDEAQVIADQEYALSVLRTLGARLQGYVFIIAGTTGLVPTINQVFGQLLRQFELIPVERFVEIAEVLSCISLPLTSLGLPMAACFRNAESVASDLMSLTDGNPYEIQLYCHAMFARWQSGATRRMELSPEALDDIRMMLEAGTDVQQHPMLAKIRAMSSVKLQALNILCSSLEHATIDELWIAYCLFDNSSMTRAKLDGYLNDFIKEGIVEIVDGTVHFSADHFEEIYLRLWSLKKYSQQGGHGRHGRHMRVLSHQDFLHVLTESLEYLLCEAHSKKERILQTCCYGMRASALARGLANLAELSDNGQVSYTVSFLYQAIMRCGIPAALDLTTVTCIYNGTEAVRWLYASDIDNIDLRANPIFVDASKRIAALGGELRSERTTIPLRPWPEILDWVVSNMSFQESRREMSDIHVSESKHAYSRGEIDRSVSHLDAAFRLVESWESANNLAYIMLKTNEYKKSIEWGARALVLPCTPKELALTRYNTAMASAQVGDYVTACNHLTAASQSLAALSFPDYKCGYLFIPKFERKKLQLREEPNVDLSAAIVKAAEVLDIIVRLQDI